MTLKLYNTMTRKKEVFTPADDKRVTMYCCGPTVYSYAHIGNARAAVAADVLFRVLRHVYPERADWKEGEEPRVVYARNITDVDDKIIAIAKEKNVDMSEITEKYARIYNEDLTALNCLPLTEKYQPKATDNIQEMADIIVELLEKDFAYITPEGHVLFDVTKMDEYGKLSGRKLDDNLAGARVQVAGYKRNPEDFLLWKITKIGELGWEPKKLKEYAAKNWAKFANQEIEITPGQPGWHIECSAMIRNVLGDTIDIHCGGQDLKFPHHENEIAQSECANGKPLAKYWVHNGFLQMDSEKMSKSLGNVKLVHELLETYDGEVLRLALLSGHYRGELDWTDALLKQSKKTLDGWYRTLRDNPIDKHAKPSLKVIESLLSDLNTAEAIAYLSNLEDSPIVLTKEQKERAEEKKVPLTTLKGMKQAHAIVTGLDVYMGDYASSLYATGQVLGLLQKDPEDWLKGKAQEGGLTDSEIKALIIERADSRAAKNWARSDEIRDTFAKENIILEDGADGTTWRRG